MMEIKFKDKLMEDYNIIIAVVSAFISIGAFVWTIINDLRSRRTEKSLALLDGKIKKSNYVSKVVFDNIFMKFQELSACLFENYNNVAALLFPVMDTTICFLSSKEEKIIKMKEFYKKSIDDCNSLIRLLQHNRFILTCDMIESIEIFEKNIKELIVWYDSKIMDICNESSNGKYVTAQQERDLIKKASDMVSSYNSISEKFKTYIKGLQIIE